MPKVDKARQKYASKKSQLTIRIIKEDEAGPGEPRFDLVLIEGNKQGLRLLGELLVAVSKDKDDDGYQMHRSLDGRGIFSKKSEFGLYLYMTGTHERQLARAGRDAQGKLIEPD